MTGGLGGAQGRAPNSVQGRVQHNHKTESEMSEGMTDSIIQPLTKSFLSSCCVPGNVLYARRDTQLNKTEPISQLLTAWKGPGGASQWRHSTSRPAMCVPLGSMTDSSSKRMVMRIIIISQDLPQFLARSKCLGGL